MAQLSSNSRTFFREGIGERHEQNMNSGALSLKTLLDYLLTHI